MQVVSDCWYVCVDRLVEMGLEEQGITAGVRFLSQQALLLSVAMHFMVDSTQRRLTDDESTPRCWV